MPRLSLICLALTACPALAAPEADFADRLAAIRLAQAFDCRDLSCKQLSSCAEACYKLLQCGQSKRDGDKDGIPCENLCKTRC
ncbi:excalibur calcium-binding domain-containing protein [Puniceibacterium confluentis]|uniref:excalibur calcium-binding domain-containing protein n=1 Tax=Puniceibacterium confluentis TaxID=1958944 RepID=UPI0011B416F0|nr:excalibur calcium-binding domain-containing protein [Puniceibacterium confluentis]